MSAVAIIAQHKGHCPACGDVIWPGDPIIQSVETPAFVHEECEGTPVAAMADRSGSRGGNVRDLDTARNLQDAHKDEVVAAVRETIRATFRAKDELHADDLAHLQLAPEHQSIIGSQIARLVNARYIVATVRRKCEHPAANGRKANVYVLTEAGRRKLAETSAGAVSPQGTPGGSSTSPPLGASAGLGEAERLFDLPADNPLTSRDAA